MKPSQRLKDIHNNVMAGAFANTHAVNTKLVQSTRKVDSPLVVAEVACGGCGQFEELRTYEKYTVRQCGCMWRLRT